MCTYTKIFTHANNVFLSPLVIPSKHLLRNGGEKLLFRRKSYRSRENRFSKEFWMHLKYWMYSSLIIAVLTKHCLVSQIQILMFKHCSNSLCDTISHKDVEWNIIFVKFSENLVLDLTRTPESQRYTKNYICRSWVMKSTADVLQLQGLKN